VRILTKELPSHIGQPVAVRGWLHKKRLLGGLTFIVLRDRSGIAQILVKDKGEVEKLRERQIGTVLSITGNVAEDQRAPGGVEIHDAKLTVDVPVLDQSPIEIDKPLDHQSTSLDTLFDYRAIGLRNLKEQAIFKVQAEVKEAARKQFRAHDFTEFNSPKLLPGATEGGAEVFKLDYFGKDATLAQSAQFYKQIMVGVFERVYEINPTYRAEPSATTRHMTEFMHIDAEMGFVEFQELLCFMSKLLNGIVDDVWENTQEYLNQWNATKPELSEKIPQLSLEEIHQKYTESTGTSTVGEKDLRPDEERFICEWTREHLHSEAVFVTEWPREGAKFYHRFKDDNQEVAQRADLLFRGVEIATASMREHRYDKLITQLRGMAGGDPENIGFKYYLDAFKYGLPPHGGFGMGLERLTQKILGLHNVKEASLFPRDINRLAP
jgi:nondiscriminating aspartyl-tRNA synthetase